MTADFDWDAWFKAHRNAPMELAHYVCAGCGEVVPAIMPEGAPVPRAHLRPDFDDEEQYQGVVECGPLRRKE